MTIRSSGSSGATTIRVRRLGQAAVLDLTGPLFLGEAVDSLHSHVQQLLGEGVRSLAVNLAEVPRMDSSGMGALVRAFTTVKKSGGNLHAFAATTEVRQMLKMVRLDSVLDLYDDEASALATL